MFAKQIIQKKYLLILGLLIVVAVFGLRVANDYGISWDEPTSRANGLITLKYVAEKISPDFVNSDKEFDKHQIPLRNYYDKEYGVVFETPIALAERVLRLNDPRDIYFFRHAATWLFSLLGIFSVYLAAVNTFNNWKAGLLAACVYLLTPRIFADFFYNSKDAIFMACYAISTYTLLKFLSKPSFSTAFLHGLACAIAIDVRITGVILIPITMAALSLSQPARDIFSLKILKHVTVFAASVSIFVVLLWPYLWTAPWHNFIAAFTKMAQFNWPGSVLYFGERVPASNLPWHYIPVWMFITTPLLYLFSFLFGLAVVVCRVTKAIARRQLSIALGSDVSLLMLCLGPISAVILLHSILYDGWRQLYFVYPSFVLIAIHGMIQLWRLASNSTALKYAAIAIFFAAISQIGFGMIRNHPHQYSHFNILAGKNLKEKFEIDYWGLSNRQALEFLIVYQPQGQITVFAASETPLHLSAFLLSPGDRVRIKVTDKLAEADYLITNFRGNATDYASFTNEYVPIHHLIINDEKINTVYRKI